MKRLSSTPDYAYLHLESVSSTNDYLKEQLPKLADRQLPVFVQADRQSGGRGRMGRRWSSPLGGVYLSCLWPDRWPADQTTSLPLVCALAVRAALQPLTSQRIALKWPNDLLVIDAEEQRKLVGILVELVDGRAIIGVGVNVLRPRPGDQDSQSSGNEPGSQADGDGADGLVSRPEGAGLRPAWLVDGLASGEFAEANACVEDPARPGLPSSAAADQIAESSPSAEESVALTEQVAASLVEQLLAYLNRWREAAGRFSAFAEEYRSHLVQTGQPVELRDAYNQLIAAGVCRGIDDFGRIIIQDGRRSHTFASGELSLRVSQ